MQCLIGIVGRVAAPVSRRPPLLLLVGSAQVADQHILTNFCSYDTTAALPYGWCTGYACSAAAAQSGINT